MPHISKSTIDEAIGLTEAAGRLAIHYKDEKSCQNSALAESLGAKLLQMAIDMLTPKEPAKVPAKTAADLDAEFEHFLSYSGFGDESMEVKAKLRTAFLAKV